MWLSETIRNMEHFYTMLKYSMPLRSKVGAPKSGGPERCEVIWMLEGIIGHILNEAIIEILNEYNNLLHFPRLLQDNTLWCK